MSEIPASRPPANAEPLQLLSIVIPARDEEGCISSTVEHLHLELRLHNVPHEIVVVDDGSTDTTWQKLQQSRERVPDAAPDSESWPARFRPGDHFRPGSIEGDAVVIMMADESDDCRDVVRYWELLSRAGTRVRLAAS